MIMREISDALEILDSIEAQGEDYYPRDFRPELSWERFDVIWKALDDARRTFADLSEVMQRVQCGRDRWTDPRLNYGDHREVWLKLGDVRRLCAAYEALDQPAAPVVDVPADDGEPQALPLPVPRVAISAVDMPMEREAVFARWIGSRTSEPSAHDAFEFGYAAAVVKAALARPSGPSTPSDEASTVPASPQSTSNDE